MHCPACKTDKNEEDFYLSEAGVPSTQCIECQKKRIRKVKMSNLAWREDNIVQRGTPLSPRNEKSIS